MYTLSAITSLAQLVNGSFEESYAGWQVYEAALIGRYQGHSPDAQAAGVDGVVAAFMPAGSVIEQIVRVQPGEAYTVFCHTACIRAGTRAMTTLGVWTLANERLALAPPLLDLCGNGFVEHSVSFVVPANTSLVRIQFKGLSLGNGATAVDNVRLIGPEAPEPVELSVKWLQDATIELRWPVSAVDYRLQETIGLAEWVDSDVSRATKEGSTWRLLLRSPAAARFYRLSAMPPVPE